jgi:hypothetical protein
VPVLFEVRSCGGELDLELRDDVGLAAPARWPRRGVRLGRLLGPARDDRDGTDERRQADPGGVENAGEAADDQLRSRGRRGSRDGSARRGERPCRLSSHRR